MVNKVFLGGTCAETTWRDELIPQLKIDYFNPVVEDWTPECQENEIVEKEQMCNIHFYMITSAMIGVFSIAEVVDSVHSIVRGIPIITILHVDPEGFEKSQIKSLKAVIKLVKSRGGIASFVSDVSESAEIINNIEIKDHA